MTQIDIPEQYRRAGPSVDYSSRPTTRSWRLARSSLARWSVSADFFCRHAIRIAQR
jgi:hypothetical protein